MGKIWILNSNSSNNDFRDKSKVDLYIKNYIEQGELVKISYMDRTIQDVIKNIISKRYLTEAQEAYIGELYVKELLESTKFLFITEDSYEEVKLTEKIRFNKNVTEENSFSNNLINHQRQGSEISHGQLYFESETAIPLVESKLTKKIVEKTRKWTFLISLIPVMYFLLNYNRRFVTVLTTSLIYSGVILGYLLLKKKADMLNFGIGILFLSLWGFRIITPYWANSISSLYIVMGLVLIFALGLYLENSIINSYFGNSKNTRESCEKFDLFWILSSLLMLLSVIFLSRINLSLIFVLIIVPWMLTAVNLRKAKFEIEEVQGEIYEETSKSQEEEVFTDCKVEDGIFKHQTESSEMLEENIGNSLYNMEKVSSEYNEDVPIEIKDEDNGEEVEAYKI